MTLLSVIQVFVRNGSQRPAMSGLGSRLDLKACYNDLINVITVALTNAYDRATLDPAIPRGTVPKMTEPL